VGPVEPGAGPERLGVRSLSGAKVAQLVHCDRQFSRQSFRGVDPQAVHHGRHLRWIDKASSTSTLSSLQSMSGTSGPAARWRGLEGGWPSTLVRHRDRRPPVVRSGAAYGLERTS